MITNVDVWNKNLMIFKILIKVFFFLLNRNFIIVNSPLQFLNAIEYLHKSKDKFFNDIYIGYTNKKSIQQIYNCKKKYKLKVNLISLPTYFELKFFHKILFIKKKFFGFNNLVIGDINYYLFKEFFKYSNFSIILDDGTSALEKINLRNKFKFFSIFKKKNNIKNNFDFLKSKIRNNELDCSLIYIIGSASVEREVLTKENYFSIIKKISQENLEKKIIYIPHRLEKPEYLKRKFTNLILLNLSIPIEVYFAYKRKLPYKIYGFYSSALFNLRKLFGGKIELINVDYSLKYCEDKNIIKRHFLIRRVNISEGIKNLSY